MTIAITDNPEREKYSNPFHSSFMISLRNNAQYIVAHYCALLFEIYPNRYAQLQKLSQSALTVLGCFKSSPEKRLKVSDIEKDTGMPRRTIQYALQTLTQKAFIQK